jgi:WhiB family transcriptional regulator, redox-sensing transcriptional regulator
MTACSAHDAAGGPDLRHHGVVTSFHCERPGPLPDDRSWVDRALCKNADPDIFFPGVGESKMQAEALQWCKVCPVTTACLADALSTPAHEDYGIRGATTARERSRMRGLR